ncbi:MAG: hypothetical protein M1838_005266 [Thelocarpon superellum]|nr:MAG: hypothetical protein M1838_005266 [Thelocarpon superellum]
MYPYCRYIRALDLRDLDKLFEDLYFHDAVEEEFYSGELGGILGARRSGRGAAKTPDVINAIGEGLMTKETPMLETLSGHVLPGFLVRWVQRLPRLESLELWQGAALTEGVEGVIHDNCPQFKKLSLYTWNQDDADEQLAIFLRGLRQQSLESLEIISTSRFGPASCIALNGHHLSLTELHLRSLEADSLASLMALKDCTALRSIDLEDRWNTLDLRKTPTLNELFHFLVSWLKSCKHLESVKLNRFISGAAIMTPVLMDDTIYLRTLEISWYITESEQEDRDLFLALGQQRELRCLNLKSFTETGKTMRKPLVEGLAKLTALQDLSLLGVSDCLIDRDLKHIARHLPNLEEIYTSGHGFTDAIWEDIGRLSKLRSLSFATTTRFRLEGLLKYISMLGPGNAKLYLAIQNADTAYLLQDHEKDLVRDTLFAKVQGRFFIA